MPFLMYIVKPSSYVCTVDSFGFAKESKDFVEGRRSAGTQEARRRFVRRHPRRLVLATIREKWARSTRRCACLETKASRSPGVKRPERETAGT
jgi:hypothetical protein